MRTTPLLALVGAAAAQQPGMMDRASAWFDNLKSQLSNTWTNPIDAGASAVAASVVQPLGVQNWKQHIMPKPDEAQEWMVYMTGGNKSCFGRCGGADRAWNLSVPILASLPQTPDKPTLKLGSIDCEANEILCTTWSIGVPAVWHFLTPATANSPDAATDLRIIRFNVSTIEPEIFTSIPSHSGSRYLDFEPYTGIMHPVDGILAKFGLHLPMGYALWLLGAIPSWLMMLVISFASRQIMSKRMNESAGLPPSAAAAAGQQQQGGAAPAPAAKGASPAGGKKQKKR